jgi:diguanylate cyclase (GGDEF)-like protein
LGATEVAPTLQTHSSVTLASNTPQVPESGSDSEGELELVARAEHLRVIFKNAPLVLLANLSGSATLAAGLWSVVVTDRLLAWLAVIVFFHLTRWVMASQLDGKPPGTVAVRQQEIFLLVATFLSGLLWGSAALLFYVPDQPAASMFLALILIAMTAASTGLLSFHRLAYPVFIVPVVLPLAFQLAGSDAPAQTAVALVIPVYFSLLWILSRQIYRFSHQAITTALVRERHALIDHLTAIPNRRAFEESLEKEWVRGIRSRRPLTLILCDVDQFKEYNDGFGHAVGDSVLRSVASLFRQAARRGSDLAARIGGDEFALLAPETDRRGASTIVANIVRNRDLLAQNTFKAWQFPTLSFGICTVIPSHSGSAFALFEKADAMLYDAKAAGKSPATDRVRSPANGREVSGAQAALGEPAPASRSTGCDPWPPTTQTPAVAPRR